MAFQLDSSAFTDQGPIPRRYTCEGEDVSPPLAWRGAPTGAKSFALVCADPDAPRGTWHHWGIYDIRAGAGAMPEAVPKAAETAGMRQVLNDFGRTGYGGPCPPPGHGRHHYHFRLFALSVENLALPSRARCPDLEKAARRHQLAVAEIVGTFERS